jgi:uncharacterized protein YecE (DUF72 family)
MPRGGARRPRTRGTTRRGRLRIGTSGWQYGHWRGVFYPPRLPQARWFDHYAAHFDNVEVNNTFYRLPAPAVFDAWREQAPAGFVYTLKLSRYVTHLRRLRDPRTPLARFLKAARRLERHLGPVLVQLPPRWQADPQSLDAFLQAAPRPPRWAVEFRDPSWLSSEVFAILRRHRAALVLHDKLPRHPLEVTSDFVYRRFHGVAYGGSYSAQALVAEAARIRDWLARGLDVFVYFNNDRDGHAVANAAALGRYVARGLE